MISADALRSWRARPDTCLAPPDDVAEERGPFVAREAGPWRAATAPEGPPPGPTGTRCVFRVADRLVTPIARYETPEQVPPA